MEHMKCIICGNVAGETVFVYPVCDKCIEDSDSLENLFFELNEMAKLEKIDEELLARSR